MRRLTYSACSSDIERENSHEALGIPYRYVPVHVSRFPNSMKVVELCLTDLSVTVATDHDTLICAILGYKQES